MNDEKLIPAIVVWEDTQYFADYDDPFDLEDVKGSDIMPAIFGVVGFLVENREFVHVNKIYFENTEAYHYIYTIPRRAIIKALCLEEGEENFPRIAWIKWDDPCYEPSKGVKVGRLGGTLFTKKDPASIIGFLVKKTRKCYYMAQMYYCPSDQYQRLHIVPKRIVTSITFLKRKISWNSKKDNEKT